MVISVLKGYQFKTVGRNHGHLKYAWASNHLTL